MSTQKRTRKRSTYRLGGYFFASRTAAKNHIRDLLNGHQDGQSVDEKHYPLLRDLLNLHPSANQKIGMGVNRFSVRTNTVWKNNKHFVIHRTDGSTTDFSFITCLEGANHSGDALGGLREAVSGQILNFKRQALDKSLRCEFTGVELTSDNAHVDHAPPLTFDRLVKDWLMLIEKQLEEIPIAPTEDNTYKREITDQQILKSWRDYHAKHAKLRVISQRANLSTVPKIARQMRATEETVR